jgi:amino acid adenylation domain-containing protein
MKLTLPQQDIYFDQLLYPNEPIYNIGAKIEIKGIIDVEIFKKAYNVLINQHDVYRSTLIKDQDNVTVKIKDNHDSELNYIDFSFNINPHEEANLFMQNKFYEPFDLFGNQLLHVFILVKVEEDFHYLFSVYHHIITDGWGTSLMFQRLVQNYNEILELGNVQTYYPYNYKDFLEDDTVYSKSDSYIEDKLYWVDKFKFLPENLFDKIDESIQINKSDRKELVIKREVYNKLNQLATTYKCSTFNLILGVLFTYFGRKHQNKDFAIGIPVLNRSKSKYKKTVGLFMGISALRLSLDFEATFEDLVNEIKNQLRKDYRHQRFPLGKLINELKVFKEKEKLFNITLSYEKQNYSSDFKSTKTKVIPLSHKSERVALAIYIREFDELDDIRIDFDYNLNYFDDLKIGQVTSHFENLISSIIDNPKEKLNSFNYISKTERTQLLIEFNNTKVDYSKTKTIVDLIEEQAVKTPNDVAIKDGNETLSYSELNRLSSQVAQYLLTNYGELDKSPIAILLDRSATMIAILLGILKSGRPYIPLDPNFPQDRLNYIINNSQAKVLIIENEYFVDNIKGLEICILRDILEGIHLFKGKISKTILPQDSAYIIYTSGSTGNPKGVEVGHQSLLNFLTSIQEKPAITSNDIFFSVTTYSFDISLLEFFLPLISGATLFVANQEILSDPNLIIQTIVEIQPTIIQATPSFYQMLFNANWEGNKNLKVLCGGDLLSESLAEKLLMNTLEVWNMYGPTETTIWSSIKKIEYPYHASNIGKPLNNTQFYILDNFLNPLPIGTSGGIYIAGDGLAKGYYKNEILTKEKFIVNPFDNYNLVYETGDVGKWNEIGEIEFLGRNDNQVKIRGYRIEIGDIESQLNQIEGVKDSVVIAKKGEQQEAFLVGFILKSRKELDEDSILNKLKLNLPYYMIPSNIVELEKFPLTPNQKIDRKALLQMNIHRAVNEKNFKKTTSVLQEKLLKLWSEVLDTNELISIDVDFFAIGGHSLNAVKLIGLIAKHFSIKISLKTIFEYSTIELLSAYLHNQVRVELSEITRAETKEFYDLTPSQYAIWLASQQENISKAYNMFAAFSIKGNIDSVKIENVIKGLISKYEILRTNFVEKNGNIYQRINESPQNYFSVAIKDTTYSGLNEEIEQFMNNEFNLENNLLIRVQLLQLEDSKRILLFCTHHIIMDGQSLELFIKEFISNYNAEVQLDTDYFLGLQFRDYSEWFNKNFTSETLKRELFWSNYLQNYEYNDSFEKGPSSKRNQQRGKEYLFELDEKTTLSLKKLALDEKVTFYTLLLTALNVLIYTESGKTDICIGTVNSGRNMHQLDKQIGLFVKTLILRTKIEKKQTFIDLLKSVRNDLFKIDEYIDIPLDKNLKFVFDVMLVYQNPEFSFEKIDKLDNVELSKYHISNKYSRIPIVFNFYENDKRLKCIVDYNCDLFEEEIIASASAAFTFLLSQILEKSNLRIELINNFPIDSEKIFTNDFDFNF